MKILILILLLTGLSSWAVGAEVGAPNDTEDISAYTKRGGDIDVYIKAREESLERLRQERSLGHTNPPPEVDPYHLGASVNFVLPQLQEFYVPLQTYSTVGGAIFGSIKRQNNQMKAYWQNRQAELNNENQQCLGLQGDENIKECLGNVRQTEIRKSETVAQYNQQHVSQQYAQSLYRQQALQNFSNQLKQAPQRFRTPTTTNCNSTGYGSGVSTNCTTY